MEYCPNLNSELESITICQKHCKTSSIITNIDECYLFTIISLTVATTTITITAAIATAID